MGTGLARATALLLIFAATIICIAPDYDLDPTVLYSHSTNSIASACAFLLVGLATPLIKPLPRTFNRSWLQSFATVLDLDCARLC
jgi:hypothetical protein